MSWLTYNQQLLRYPQLGFSLDLSLMEMADSPPPELAPRIAKAFADMAALEAGAIANPDEGLSLIHI